MRIMQKRDMQMLAEAVGGSDLTAGWWQFRGKLRLLFCARRHPNVGRQVER